MKTAKSQNSDQLLLEELSQIVLENLMNPQFGVASLAEAMDMSRSHLHRKLKRISGQSLSQFIRTLRLEKALEMIQEDETQTSISEIAYLVGFNSTSYFNKCFREKYGYSPKVARTPSTTKEAPKLEVEITHTNQLKLASSRLKQIYYVVMPTLLIVLLFMLGYYVWREKGDFPAAKVVRENISQNNLVRQQKLLEQNIGREEISNLALKALEEDAKLAEAYSAMASIYSNKDYDQYAAEQAFKRVIELNPNYTTAYQFYAEHLSIVGKHNEARKYINQALELDSSSLVIRYVSAKLYYDQGSFEKALNEIQICYELYERHRSLLKGLFRSDDILKISLETDWETLLKDRADIRSYHSAKLSYVDEHKRKISLPLKLKVRGNFKRKKNNCDFPPLKLRFDSIATTSTIFAGEDQLKLLTHCQSKEEVYEQYLLEEYFIYRMYSQLTDFSFRVRLLEVAYIDEEKTKDSLVRYALLLENKESLAERLRGKIVESPNVQVEQLDVETMNKLAVFQYFIGNLDWSIPNGHNIILLGENPAGTLHPVPYDFDFSRLVNSHYNGQKGKLDFKAVTNRIFNGFYCTDQSLEKNFREFRQHKASFQAIISTSGLLEENQKRLVQIYMEQFYNIINDPEKVETEFVNIGILAK